LGKKKTSRALVDEKFAAIELAAGLDPDTLPKSPLSLEVAVQPNIAHYGFHAALNARSPTPKSMHNRDGDSTIANLKDDWQPPTSAPSEVRKYRKQLLQHIAAPSPEPTGSKTH
jgi:hypothetical protein